MACKKEAAASGAGKPPPALVNVVPAIARDVPEYLDEIGKTNAVESVTIMPQVSGRLEALHFKDGQDLKAGQLLFTIDVRPFEAVLHQAEGQLAKDQAASANANQMFNRQTDIFKQGIVAPADYDTALYNAKAAKAAVEADEAAVASAKLNVEYCSIRSPIDGRAGMRLVDPGNIVKINETPLLMIQRLNVVYADFTINERDLPRVRARMADHTLKTFVRLPSETSEGREGDLTFLDTVVQDATGTVRLRATIPNADRHFWPGQFVNIRLVVAVKKDAVLIPAMAQLLGQGKSKSNIPEPFCYVVNNQGIAEFRPLVLGQPQKIKVHDHVEDWIVVDSGVKAGEKVITVGQLLVFPGAPVNVAAPTTLPAEPQTVTPTTMPTTGPTTAPTTQPSVALAPYPLSSGERAGVRGERGNQHERTLDSQRRWDRHSCLSESASGGIPAPRADSNRLDRDKNVPALADSKQTRMSVPPDRRVRLGGRVLSDEDLPNASAKPDPTNQKFASRLNSFGISDSSPLTPTLSPEYRGEGARVGGRS